MTQLDLTTLCPGCFADKGRVNPCPHCGYDEQAPRGQLLLPQRTVLHGQFLVGRVLGKPGGFGITYLGWDLGLHRRIAIKEFLPRELAGRSTGSPTIAPHTQEDGELFRYGLTQFQTEARTLAQLDNPNIVKVLQVFEANGTAYLVMEYYAGLTLAEYLERQGGRLAEDQAKQLLRPVLDGLRAVHAKGFLHRDIKPQNVYLARTDTGTVRPILLDFGAARRALGERSQSMSVVISPGYAPFEQYHRRGRQGTWTDVYAVGAVLYRMVTGVAPPEANERKEADELKPATAFGVSPTLSNILDGALAMKAEARPQTVQALQAQLWPDPVPVLDTPSKGSRYTSSGDLGNVTRGQRAISRESDAAVQHETKAPEHDITSADTNPPRPPRTAQPRTRQILGLFGVGVLCFLGTYLLFTEQNISIFAYKRSTSGAFVGLFLALLILGQYFFRHRRVMANGPMTIGWILISLIGGAALGTLAEGLDVNVAGLGVSDTSFLIGSLGALTMLGQYFRRDRSTLGYQPAIWVILALTIAAFFPSVVFFSEVFPGLKNRASFWFFLFLPLQLIIVQYLWRHRARMDHTSILIGLIGLSLEGGFVVGILFADWWRQSLYCCGEPEHIFLFGSLFALLLLGQYAWRHRLTMERAPTLLALSGIGIAGGVSWAAWFATTAVGIGGMNATTTGLWVGGLWAAALIGHAVLRFRAAPVAADGPAVSPAQRRWTWAGRMLLALLPALVLLIGAIA